MPSLPTRGRPTREQIFERFAVSLVDLRRVGGLPTPDESESIWEDIWHREVHHSTAIEGNTLVLKEVKELLDTGRTVGRKPLKEYLEVVGYGHAAKWVYRQALSGTSGDPFKYVTVTEVRQIHQLAMTPVWDVAPHPDAGADEGPGAFRRHDIHPFPGGMTPTPWPMVEAELTGWVDELNKALGGEERDATFADPGTALCRIAGLHAAFERVHPFLDGNGRTGRLVLNLVLVRLGWPTAIIYKSDRDKYLRALDRCDGEELAPLGELLARSMITNLEELMMPKLAGPAKMVPLASLADDDMSLPALQQAVGRGRLVATRGLDGKWRSSKQAVSKYKKSRSRGKRRT